MKRKRSRLLGRKKETKGSLDVTISNLTKPRRTGTKVIYRTFAEVNVTTHYETPGTTFRGLIVTAQHMVRRTTLAVLIVVGRYI